MTLKHSSLVARALLASGILFGAAAAQAATGYDITQGQEGLVHPGMTMSQVQRALGRPEQKMAYADQAGPTWTYQVQSPAAPGTKFDVDFGANGKVASARQLLADLG